MLISGHMSLLGVRHGGRVRMTTGHRCTEERLRYSLHSHCLDLLYLYYDPQTGKWTTGWTTDHGPPAVDHWREKEGGGGSAAAGTGE